MAEISFKQYVLMEGKNMVHVWHVSPVEWIYKLRPTGSHQGVQAHKQNQSGIYVSPHFSDAIAWAASFIIGKKNRSQEKNRSPRLQEIGGGWHKKGMYYRQLTFYKIAIPRSVLEKAWEGVFWEHEYFIPEDKLEHLEIISSQVMGVHEINALYHKQIVKSNESSSVVNLARDVRLTNLAAKSYLIFSDKYNNLLLRRPERKSQEIEGLLKNLKFLFMTWDGKSIDRLEDKEKAQKIIKELEQRLK